MITTVEAQRQIADARRSAAEEIGWWLAFFVAWVVYLKTDSLLVAFLTFIGVVFAVGYLYGKQSKEAWAMVDNEQLPY